LAGANREFGMNRSVFYRIFLALGVIALLVGGFLSLFERKDVTEQAVASGEARSNRFYALSLILQRLDIPVTSLTSLEPEQMPLHAGDTLLLGDDPGRVDVEQAIRITAWVRHGGHLLLSPDAEESAVHTPLMDALGLLDPKPGTQACSALHAAGGKGADVELCGQRFRLTPAASANVDAAVGTPADGYLFARTKLGSGRVSVLADLGPLSAGQLDQPGAQHFVWRLLAPNMHRGQVYLVYALDGPSFLKLLSIEGWPALLSLGVLLLAWMAMRSVRLGPLMPVPTPHRRALLEHVQAVGEFLYRRDRGRSLHSLACDTVLASCRRRDPASAMLNGEPLYERLAQRSGLEPAQIAQAFRPPANAVAFRACIITLARLRSRP
jgi:hypothetical protein